MAVARTRTRFRRNPLPRHRLPIRSGRFFAMSRFWSDLIQDLSPYVPGEQPKSVNLIKLNTNENPYGPSPRAVSALNEDIGRDLRLYPDPYSTSLRTAVASRYGLSPDYAFAGNGSDEVLALAFATFFKTRAGSEGPLQYPDVSYSFYPVWARFFEIEVAPVPLSAGLELDLRPYREGRGGIIFPNPNAPTAMALGRGEIESLLRDTPDRVTIVDEAYVEFGAESVAPLVSQYENLLVVQTLSKSHGLAGLRVGFAIGHPDLIEGLDRAKSSFNSYPIDRIAERIACEALGDEAYFEGRRDQVVATREWTTARLASLGFSVLPSAANFVFATHSSVPAKQLFEGLRARDVLVRYFEKPRIDDYLRITIGTDDEMKGFIAALESMLDGPSADQG